ncbi:glycosyltransferase family 39 protein [Actibacterium sp. MT2.3-13A]|uniref:ArnT family glycosyltransferase n=1 Tax=Actibacterium sp. MT2.3-13A TaxID=2828332 RepID=UPI001BA8014E|nr:glycosyltransferase family 39 protein [Actibacterium sp. MT2.3-13A]
MPKNANPEHHLWLMPALALVGAITAARLVLLWFNRMDLFVDEAQYWLWGQELALGYYSKPPMIGWVIRAVTDLAGSDAPFWVRLPAPLFHGATALILGAAAARLFGARAAVVVAAGYATLPMVALASILISTDTIMFPFLAAALLGYLHLLERGGAVTAALTGVALGLAFLSKYAAIYYLICAPLAAVALPAARPRVADALVVLALFGLVISPNILWNMQHGFTTLAHTLDNADWVRDPGARAGLHFGRLAEFLGAQFAVFGPVLFGGLIWLALRARQAGSARQFLLLFALPVIAVVCVQALLSKAYANWAAAAYLAGSVAVLPWLTGRWRAASFALNGAVALALPLLGVFADSLSYGPKDRLIAARHVGQAEMSRAIIDAARTEGLNAIVTGNRDLLADLFYTGRDSGLRFFALPPQGRAPHHYALKYPLPADLPGDVLFVDKSDTAPACAAGRAPLAAVSPERGAHRGKTWYFHRLPADCWAR